MKKRVNTSNEGKNVKNNKCTRMVANGFSHSTFEKLDHESRKIKQNIKQYEIISPDNLHNSKTYKSMNIAAKIAYVGVVHDIDVSRTKTPDIELKRIISVGRDKYLDGNWEEMDLRKHFSASLPMSFYSYSQLTKLAKLEGIKVKSVMSPHDYRKLYSALQAFTVSMNFHYRIKSIKWSTDIIPITMDHISEVKDYELIPYGSKNSSMTPYTYNVLYDTFENSQNFLNPLSTSNKNRYYEPYQINKLSQMCRAPKLQKESDIHFKLRKKLYSLIKKIIIRDSNLDKVTKTLIKLYYGKEKDQQLLTQILNKIVDLSMYMRAWEGPGNKLPITISTVKNQHEVDLRVTQAMMELTKILNKRKMLGDTVMNLPLYKYMSNKFIRITDPDRGKTIGERIKIVENNVSIHSCIRTSSNFLLHSIAKFSEYIDYSPNFDVKKLRWIA